MKEELGGHQGQVLNGIGDWLTETGPPDIVLFSSPGGNDALEQHHILKQFKY